METPVIKLLKVKGSDVVSTLPSTTIFDAVKLMEDNRIGSLPIIDSAGKLVGMLTERDCLRRVLLKELPLRSITVAEVMSTPVITVQGAEIMENCMKLMTEKRLRHLPVMEHSKLIGIISIGDVVKFLCSEQEQDIRNLENYITGSL